MRSKRRNVYEFTRRLCGWMFCGIAISGSTLSAAEPLAGKPFEAALDHSIGRAWGGQDGNPLRDVFRQLTESQRISIMLDRRIDPTQSIELTLPPTPLRDILAALAHTVEAEISVVGSVVYVGPTDSAKKLRTLVELRNNELSKFASGASSNKSLWRNRHTSLTQKRTFVWQDLDRPRDVLQLVAVKFQIEIDGLNKLPHDLWPAASLPQVTATEALSLLLVQFGSTFEFVPDRAAVRIVPIPERVLIERTHTVPANSPVTVDAAREHFSDSEVERSGSKLLVRGTVEQQAEIASWLKSGGRKPVQSAGNKPSKALSERRFTLPKQRNVALSDFIKTFTDFGIKITYDQAQFVDANISLDQKIDIDAKDVSIEKLFRDHFGPLGIEVTIDGEIVRLKPKSN